MWDGSIPTTYQESMVFFTYFCTMIDTVMLYTALPGDMTFGTRGRVRMNGFPFMDSVKRFLPTGIFSPPHSRLLYFFYSSFVCQVISTSLPVMATAVSRTHRWQEPSESLAMVRLTGDNVSFESLTMVRLTCGDDTFEWLLGKKCGITACSYRLTKLQYSTVQWAVSSSGHSGR